MIKNILTFGAFQLILQFQFASGSKLQILHPKNLKNNISSLVNGTLEIGALEQSLGNFGDFSYLGQTLRGRVHYPLTNKDGCQEFQEADFVSDHLKEASLDGHKPIIMVDRGNCHFVIKAKNIQKFGAIMALIADNKEFEDPEKLIMSDDGTGKSIKIPTFLIAKNDSVKIKETIHQIQEEEKQLIINDFKKIISEATSIEKISRNWANLNKDREGYNKKGHQVIIQAQIDYKSQKQENEQIKVDLWYSNIYEIAASGVNLKQFSKMGDIFKEQVSLTPRILTRSCSTCSQKVKDQMCIKNGKYCSVLPGDNNLYIYKDEWNISPYQIIQENIYELCVFDSIDTRFKSHWFIYMQQLIDSCVFYMESKIKMRPVTQQCRDNVHKYFEQNPDVKIDMENYQNCIFTQYQNLNITLSDDINTFNDRMFIDRDMIAIKQVGTISHPSISINNISYRGDYHDPNQIFKALCQSITSNRPQLCKSQSIEKEEKYSPLEDALYGLKLAIEDKENYDRQKQGLDKQAQTTEVVLSFIFVLLFSFLCVIFCRLFNNKKNEVQMKQKVQENVAQYFQLASQDESTLRHNQNYQN